MEVRHRKKHTTEEHTTLVENEPILTTDTPKSYSDSPPVDFTTAPLITYNPVDLLWKTKEFVFEYLSYMAEYLWKHVMNCVPLYTPQINPKTR
jgi:hypothetical protein